MAKYYRQPVGVAMCPELCFGVFRYPPRDNWPPRLPNLSKEQEEVLDREIHALMDKGAIEPAQDRRGFFSPMFAVPKKDGGWRPIINLKHLNAYLHVSHFKMEGYTV